MAYESKLLVWYKLGTIKKEKKGSLNKRFFDVWFLYNFIIAY